MQIKIARSRRDFPVYDIVGVTSYGAACGLLESPGVYAKVYSYLDWIEKVVWPAFN